jgi:hypothetical protein
MLEYLQFTCDICICFSRKSINKSKMRRTAYGALESRTKYNSPYNILLQIIGVH